MFCFQTELIFTGKMVKSFALFEITTYNYSILHFVEQLEELCSGV